MITRHLGLVNLVTAERGVSATAPHPVSAENHKGTGRLYIDTVVERLSAQPSHLRSYGVGGAFAPCLLLESGERICHGLAALGRQVGRSNHQ